MVDMFDSAGGFSDKIGLPSARLNDLRSADDWTFVIRSSALLEAALTKLIVEDISRPTTKKFVSKLQFSRKVDFAKALDLVPEFQKFISYLAELRNTLIHNIEFTEFSFDSHLAYPENLTKLRNAVRNDFEGHELDDSQLQNGAKDLLWLFLMGTLAFAFAHVELLDLRKKRDAFYRLKGTLVGTGLGDAALWSKLGE